MKKALTKKLGPAPRWVWALTLTVIIILYLRHRAAQNAAAATDPNATPDQQSAYASPYNDSGTGAPYYDSGPGSGAGGGSSTGPGLPPTTSNTDPGPGGGPGGDGSIPPQTNAPPAQGQQPIIINVNGGTSPPISPTSKGRQGHKLPPLTGGTNAAGLKPIRAPSGHTKPPPKKGYKVVGLGGGNWEYKPLPKTKPPSRPKTGNKMSGSKITRH